MNPITIRLGTIAEIPIMVYHRRSMFAEMGVGNEETFAKMDMAFAQWAERRIKAEEFYTWFACDGDAIIGGAGLLLIDWPASPDGDVGRKAYVYNVYVEPNYRKQGIARRLMDTLLDDCRTRGLVHVRLHASDAGRPLYEKMGFLQTNEMGIVLHKSN